MQCDRALRLGVGIITAAVFCLAPIAARGAEPAKKPLEWRVLLIIKAQGDIATTWMPNVQYQMSRQDIQAVTVAFNERTPEYVKFLSNGRLIWKPDVVVSREPLTKVSGDAKGALVSPECVQEDLEKYAPPGKYDGVFIYWKDRDDRTNRGLNGGFGWTSTSANGHKGLGFTCVNYMPLKDIVGSSGSTEVFLHEWLHQLEAFYLAKGVRICRGGLHGNDNYGFKDRNGWKHWYAAFMNAQLPEEDGGRSGLGENAWRWGTMREEVGRLLPGFMTAARIKSNLLINPSFEEGMQGWSSQTYLRNPNVFSVATDPSKTRKEIGLLKSISKDDAWILQKVKVRPHNRYVLGGWIRTENVVIAQPEGTKGAHLLVHGKKQFASESIIGTSDWRYLAVQFVSNDLTEVEINLRLGGNGSVATGSAWFDDFVLIELPELPPPVKYASKNKK
jgi:hypothetical protein